VKGFAMVPTHVLRNRALSASARLLYGVILTYAWGENPCKASNETLCADCGIGRTALYDALNALKAGELIDVKATGHTQAVFTPERRTKIRARLAEGYTPLDIRTAIDGAAKAPFVNDAGKRFDDLTLICRNGSKLEDFIDRAQVRQSSNVSRSTLGDLDKLRSYGSASAPRGSADDLRRRAGGH
jgi:hypothetical protein